MTNVDYSDRAVTMRIRRISQLRNLCLSLARAKRLSDEAKKPPIPPPASR